MGIDKFVRKIAHEAERTSRDYIPGVIEKFETQRIPHKIERKLSIDDAEQLASTLVTPANRETLDGFISSFPDGRYRAREEAGTLADGNRHVHDFILNKSGEHAQIFFIDPEHAMGKSKNRNAFGIPRIGDLRPQINVLYGAELRSNDPVPRLSLLRYRAASIPDESKHLNKPSAQLQIAQSMLTTGTLPDVLQGHENEISFRLDLHTEGDSYRILAQARAARDAADVEHMIDHMIARKDMLATDPLEGQLRRFRSIIRTHFPRHFRENNFVVLDKTQKAD